MTVDEKRRALHEFCAPRTECKGCPLELLSTRESDYCDWDSGADFDVHYAFGLAFPQTADNVNRPSHYTAGKVECIDAMESAVIGLEGMEAVLTAQVLKYLWRWKKKNGVEDLRKAEWYLKRLIALVGGKADE